MPGKTTIVIHTIFSITPEADLPPQIGKSLAKKCDGVIELRDDLANVAGGRSNTDECSLKQM